METITIITKEDLIKFKQDLIESITILLEADSNNERQWIKAKEVKAILHITDNSLSKLRVSNQLDRVRVGKSYYFDKKQVLNLFETKNTNG